MARDAAVGIDDDLAAGEAGVTERPTDHEVPGGVDKDAGAAVEISSGDNLSDNRVLDVSADAFLVDIVVVLSRDDDGIHADGLAVRILNSYLALAIWPEIRDAALLPGVGQLPAQILGKLDGERHQLRCLIAGETDHHALVASADRFDLGIGHLALLLFERVIDAHCDVGRLTGETNVDVAVGGRTQLAAGVADAVEHAAHQLLDFLRRRQWGHFAIDRDPITLVVRLGRGLARDSRARV